MMRGGGRRWLKTFELNDEEIKRPYKSHEPVRLNLRE
jgi:hypothetical protein